MRDFELRREDEEREENLNAGAVFQVEVAGGDLHQFFGLFAARVAGHVERIFNSGNDEEAEIVKGYRFVAHVKRHFHKDGLHPAEVFRQIRPAVFVFDIPLGKGKGWQEAEIEMVSDLEVGDDSQVESRSAYGFHAHNAVVLDEFRRAEGFETGGVETQRDAEIVGFLLEFEEIVIVAAVEFLCRRREKAHRDQGKREHYFSQE